MSKLKIAIACQGGGSQTAFTAGALKTLCEARIGQEFDVVGISGTSGGAVCARAVLATKIAKQETTPNLRIASSFVS